jgi:hypothetical protein
VEFSSSRSAALFEILGPLRHLSPELADRVTAHDPQLAAAAALCPYGWETVNQPAGEVKPFTPEERADWIRQNDLVIVGSASFRIVDELETGFRDSMALAAQVFAADTDPARPNGAPKECWPSTNDYRAIVCRAARYEGRAALPLLDRIADDDLRMLAQVALAGELAGLPDLGAVVRFHPAPPRRECDSP